MSVIFYPDSIRKNINLFGDLHNEIPINRRKNDSLVTYTVPIQLGNKEKVFAFLRSNESSQYSIRLPRLAFNVESIDYDEERNINPITKILATDKSQFIFKKKLESFGLKERQLLVDETEKLSIRKQCDALNIHRSGLYYTTKPEKE